MTRLGILIAATTLSISVSAQPIDRDTISLRQVEVYGSPKAPVELLPLSVSIITAQQLDKSSESSILPVIGNQVPGLFVTQRGLSGYGVSDGAAGMVNIRGVGSNDKVLFMIDGQPQWASIYGHALPDTYTSSDVAKIEVVRGPSSMLYGSNAMGGSVNIITKHATQQGLNGSARAMWGSYGTQKYNASLGYNNGKANAFVNATYESSDGTRPNSQYWLASQFGSLQYRFSEHWRSGANITLTETKPHNAGSVFDPLKEMYTKMLRGTAAVFLNNNYDISSGQLQLYANWGNHEINDGYSASGTETNGGVPRDYLFHSKDFNMGINTYQNIRPWSANVTSVGVDLQHWGGKTWYERFNQPFEDYEVDKSVNEIAAYVMMQQDLAQNLVSLNAGIRFQHSSQFGNILVPQAGFILRPIRNNTIKFSWGKGFRSPNLCELYMYPSHNPELKPEYLWNYEVEIRQRFLGGRLDAGLALFYIDGKDMIQLVAHKNPFTGAPMTKLNIGDFQNKGFEVDATYHVNSQWMLTANYSYLHTSENVLYAPKNKVFAQVMYHPGAWEFSLESSSIWSLRTGGPQKENYSLLNGRVGYNLSLSGTTSVNIFCKIDNITATKYETMYGYPMPRATAMAGFEVKF